MCQALDCCGEVHRRAYNEPRWYLKWLTPHNKASSRAKAIWSAFQCVGYISHLRAVHWHCPHCHSPLEGGWVRRTQQMKGYRKERTISGVTGYINFTRTFCRSETQRSELLERQREPQQQNEAASTEHSDFSICTGYSDIDSCSYFHGLAMIIS